MSGFGVEPAELHAAQVALDNAADEGRAELARLRASAQDLLCGWQGGAAVAFGRGWHEWLDGALLVLSALEASGQALGLTGHEYADAETTVRVGMERIAS